jgi:DUF1680 family protein
MMWNQRMFLLTGDAKYADVVERGCFNGVLSGVSLSGDRFFYTNPCVYDGSKKNNSGFAGRVPWFGCACCPPNEMRTLAALTGYFYATKGDAIYVNFYAQSEAAIELAGQPVRITQATAYPWDGAVRITVTPAAPRRFSLRLRIPEWAQGRPLATDLYAYDDPSPAAWSARVAGAPVAATLDHGYATITREWQPGDTVELDLPMAVRAVHGNPLVAATKDRIAFERGPIVYCVEAVNREYVPENLGVVSPSRVATEFRPDLLGGVDVLLIDSTERERITAIPYFSWNNRGLAPMAVWLRRVVPPMVGRNP